MKTAHANIPIFIPHLGCPNCCVFCDQRTISGRREFELGDARRQIEEALTQLRASRREVEIAFFGGSFTGIDRSLMLSLLDLAQSYVGDGVCGIRMSTRPDYIDDEIVAILKGYTVAAVELGIQTMSPRVLEASRRGHSVEDTRRAVRLLCDAGFSVVGQMMIGLPESTREDELQTAREICALGCSAARIYPTVVLCGTQLEEMREHGTYSPLSVDEAVSRSTDVLEIFETAGVDCLRIGLCDSELLHSSEHYSAGPAHPAMGELVRGELWRRRISSALKERSCSRERIVIEVPRGALSAAIGQKRINRAEYEHITGSRVTVRENASLDGRTFAIYDAQEADEVCI